MAQFTGQCAMRGSCGTKGWFGQPLPCPYDGPPEKPHNVEFETLIASVCGPSFVDIPLCCTSEQVETLRDSLAQAEGLISSCPACRNNFRSFYCHFTCSPDQGTFLNVTSTQETSEGLHAVESVDFFVGKEFSTGFFDSCKNVKYGASNGFAMDLIGGGAEDYRAFLRFMGDEKPLGSPFQINYPTLVPMNYTMFDPLARNCFDNDPSGHCSCVDCPNSCPTLPYIPSPYTDSSCRVGSVTCLTFVLLSTYGLAVLAVVSGFFFNLFMRRRREKTFERVALLGDPPLLDISISPRGLVGASSLAQPLDGEASSGQSESRHLGRGATLLDPLEALQPRRYQLNTFLRRVFYRIGATCANYPWLSIALSFTVVALCNIGWKQFEVETDPVRLWVAPTSESKLQKQYFDENFGPFYRTEQLFITSSGMGSDEANSMEAVLTWDRLQWWFAVEAEIRSLKSEPNGYTLDDVCYKPAGPQGPCVIQSIAGWFGNSLEKYNSTSWAQRIRSCSSQPVNCLPDFGQPLIPEYLLGGAPGNEQKDWLESQALITTLVVMDSLDNTYKKVVEEWERALRTFLVQLSSESVDKSKSTVAFSTGVSLEEELNKSTNTDIKIVVLSYMVMFFYVAFTLGGGDVGRDKTSSGSILKQYLAKCIRVFRRSPLNTIEIEDESLSHSLPRRLFVGSKFTLGIFGITLVILSVSTSVGVFSIFDVKVTLIIAEVIPFLVLAVGVDNVFILVHELDRQNLMHGPNASNITASMIFSPISPARHLSFESTLDDHVDTDSMPLHLTPEERVARTVAKMGPSILLSSITEIIAFALGALVPMPAVRNFALYAAGSVLVNAILQLTAFIGALTIDLRRTEAGRIDCFPCIRLPSRIALTEAASASGLGRIALFMRRSYAPYLMRPVVKGCILISFTGIFVGSIISMQHIQLGLDQRLALPAQSYLIPYFDAVDLYLDVGPPVYFVSQDVNVTSIPGQRHLCGRFTTCDEMSLVNVLEVERGRPEASFISQPTASWLDDFLRWLDPSIDTCCRVKKSDPEQFCGVKDRATLCKPCFQDRKPDWNISLYGMPEGDEFMKYLQQWLVSPTDEACPLGGRAAYGSALSLTSDKKSVQASHFRTFHSPLKNQNDFINAFTAAHRIADEISAETGTKVFPYSLFYVFFDQYTHIIAITQEILGLALASVLLITSFLLGSWRTGTIVTGVVALTVVNVMGVMGIWHIDLNAISLVNLVISLGIAVEFCSHIARAFMGAGVGYVGDNVITGQKERDERMWTALVDVGPSVLSGITFTKLIGISVMALTRSKLLEIYYFRMWLSLIVSGALHGLVLLPVVLSLAGGPGYSIEDSDEEWMSNAIRKPDYEYTPFLTDSRSDDSDS